MIKESMFLFLLIGVDGSIEKKYIGRLNHCDESVAVYERMLAEYNNINGFLCLDKADARLQKKYGSGLYLNRNRNHRS